MARPRKSKGRPPGTSPWWALLFVGPTMLGLGVFYLWPIVRTAYLSFNESGAFGGYSWVGLDNYTRLFNDPQLIRAVLNTGQFALISLLSIPIALVIAGLLHTENLQGRGIYRTLYFVPVVTMPAAVALVWKMIYNGDYGILNQILGVFGVQGKSWLTDPTTAMVAIALVSIWMGLGQSVVIFLAGLQGVPESILEAAELDGAGPIRKFISITLPMISPSIFFVSIINVIGSLQVFDLVFLMVGSTNPAYENTRTIVALFYRAGFIDSERGYAAAIAVFLLVIILALTALQFRMQKKWVHYE